MTTPTMSKMSFSDKFRTWKNDDGAGAAAPSQKPNNPFSRQDRRDRYGSQVSYAEHKRKKEEEAKEKEKNRPLTADDFPSLGGKPVVVKAKSDPNRSTLAVHIAETIKKDEEDAVRRRIQREVEEERKRKEEGFVRLPLYGSVEAYFKAKRAQAASAEATVQQPPPPTTVTFAKKKFTRPSMMEDEDDYQDDYVQDNYVIHEQSEEDYDSQMEEEMR